MNRIALLAALALAACSTIPTPDTGIVDEATDDSAYLALGTEPGWTLEITPDRLNYIGDYGDTRIAEANPGARTSFNGHRYQGDRLTVDITHVACNDGMSDRRYADTVILAADGKQLRGCGGAILPPADLGGTRWRVITIGSQDAAPGIAALVAFDGTTMSGSFGCNSFSGGYSSDGSRLSAGPFQVTEMACIGTAGAQEETAFSILSTPVSIRFGDNGRMILMGQRGRSIVLEQVI